jgi:ribonuclease BN (tRNA processing enzyme)
VALSVTVLGSSGVYGGVHGACSGYLVRAGGTAVLMDAGPGSLANLQRHVGLGDLDAIVLSHSHPDHWVELPVLRNALRYVLGRSGVALYATAETLELADPLCGDTLGATFSPTVITDRSEFRTGPIAWRTARTDHPVETMSFAAVVGGTTLAYSADTGPGWSLADLARDVDLALVEATFLDGAADPHPVHLEAPQAGRIAREANARRLVLTHLLPGTDVATSVVQAEHAYGAPVEHADLHRRFDL